MITVALKAIWAFLKGIPLWVYAVVAVILLTAFVVNAYGDRRFEQGAASVRKEFDAFKVQLEQQRQRAIEVARDKEIELQDKDRQALETLRRENRETVAERDRIIASIRADNLRLQERFRHQAGTRVPNSTGGTTGDSGTRECGLRREDEEFIIREAARADQVVNKLTACQAKLNATQRALNGRE